MTRSHVKKDAMSTGTPTGISTVPVALDGADRRVVRACVDLRGLGGNRLQVARLTAVADVLCRCVWQVQGRRIRLAVLQPPHVTDAPAWLWFGGFAMPESVSRVASPAEAEEALAGPLDLALGIWDGPEADVAAVRLLRVGTTEASCGSAELPGMLALGEPLALRLALLRFPLQAPAVLSRSRLHRADETLRRWRFKVAGWKDRPAEAAPPAVVTALRKALLPGLDTAAVLRMLHRMETDIHCSSASKFTVFTYADRMLGLDLRRLIDHVHA